MESDAMFHMWQSRMVPLMYDAFYHHHLHWPTQACRWGATQSSDQYKKRCQLFYSEQTDNSEPQKLIVASVDVFKPRVCSAEVVSEWRESKTCPHIRESKVLYHPGEVNKIREVPCAPHVLVTHTDSPELLVWNTDTQPDRGRAKAGPRAEPNKCDLRLVGHKDLAEFPLAASSAQPLVASGGRDKLVLVWSLADALSGVLAGGGGGGGGSGGKAGSGGGGGGGTLAARASLKGHTHTVEDVVFKPGSSEQLASVGDDHALLLWDTRTGTSPVSSVKDAHGRGHDVQCVDWEPHGESLLATGADDGSLRIWDVRKVGAPAAAAAAGCVHTFAGVHTGGIIRLEWHPRSPGVFASGGEDKLINVWQLGAAGGGGGGDSGAPPELLFRHAGHRHGKVVDFQWSPDEDLPWTMVSVSDHVSDGEQDGGGSLQLWRVNDLIYRPEDEVVAEINAHTAFVVNGEPPAVDGRAGGSTQAAAAAGGK